MEGNDSDDAQICKPGGTLPGHIVPGLLFLILFTSVYVLDIKYCLTTLKNGKSRNECDRKSGDLLNDKRFLLWLGVVTGIASFGGGFVELIPSMVEGGRPWMMSVLHLGLYSSWFLVSASSFLQRSSYLGRFSMILATTVAAWFNAIILSGHLDHHMATAGKAMKDLHLWLMISSLVASLLNGVATIAPRSFRLRATAYCSVAIHGGWWIVVGFIAFMPNDGICTFNAGWIPSIFVFTSTGVIIHFVVLWLFMLRIFGNPRTENGPGSDVEFFMRDVSASYKFDGEGYEVVVGTEDDSFVEREMSRVKKEATQGHVL